MAFSKVKVGGLADDSVTAANIDDDGTGYTVGNLTNSGTLQQTGQATFGSGGTNWTLPTARGTDKYVLQINGTTGAATWEESLTAPEISGHNFDVSGSTDDGGINAYEAPYELTGTLTNSSTTISAINTTNLLVGQYISGAGIPADTTISAIPSPGSSGSITISNQTAADAANTGVALKIQKTPGEKNGGKVTLTGANFGATIGEITVAITTSGGAVIANASYLSGLSGGNTITAEWTGTEGSYSTDLTSSYTGSIYFKMTKSGLASNVHNTNTTLTSDPAVTALTGSSQTGGDVFTDPTSSSLGEYGGRTIGGGQDSNTKLLLNFDRNGGTDIEDSSNRGGNGHEVSVNGGATIFSSPFGDGKSAFFYDGSDDYMTIPGSSSLAFGTGAFTIELWLKATDLDHGSYINLFDFRDNDADSDAFWLGFEGSVGSGVDGRLYMYHGSAVRLLDDAATITENHWHHLAVTRVGDVITAYVDGKATGTTYTMSSGTNLSAQNTVHIGRYFSSAQYYFKGYLDEIRMVKGVAVYTGDFEVPKNRLSTTQTNQGTNIADITGSATSLLLRSGREVGHIDLGSNPATQTIDLSRYAAGEVYTVYFLGRHTNNKFNCYGYLHWNGSSQVTKMVYNYDSDHTDVIVNGTGALSGTGGQVSTSHGEPSDPNYYYYTAGFCNSAGNALETSNRQYVRIAKGQVGTPGDGMHVYYAVSTDSSTPTLSGIKTFSDITTNHTITTDGIFQSQFHGGIASAMTWPTSGKRTGSPGIYFDGSGDYLTVTHNTAFNIAASSTFTIDFWLYTLSNTQNDNIMSKTATGNTYQGWDIRWSNPNNYIGLCNNSNGVGIVDIQQTIYTHTWYHICFTGDGTTLKAYLNGILKHSVAQSNFAPTNHNNPLYIGKFQNFSDREPKCYLDSIRFSTSVRTSESGDPCFVHASPGTTTGGALGNGSSFVKVPTKIYGAFGEETPDVGTITLTATGDGDFTWSEMSQGTALPGTLAVGSTAHSGSGNSRTHTATITGTLPALTTSIANGTRSDQATNNILLKVQHDTDATKAVTLNGATGMGITQKSTEKPVLFNARRYVGTGVAPRDINEFGFKPDFIWIKERDDSDWHVLYDSIRGNSQLFSNNSNAQGTSTTQVTSFNSDGYTFGNTGAGNADGKATIAWAWKAGGVPSADGKKIVDGVESNAVSGTDYGAISGTTPFRNVRQSINTAGGFNITKFRLGDIGSSGSFNGSWFKHGLGSSATDDPDFFIIKNISQAQNWFAWHSGTGAWSSANGGAVLNTNAAFNGSNVGSLFKDTTTSGMPTGDGKVWIDQRAMFAAGVDEDFVCYTWKAVAGVSAFGTYDGAVGTRTITTNFEPSFLIIKRKDGAGAWYMYDKFRGTAQTSSDYTNSPYLVANEPNQEATTDGWHVQFQSNGFHIPDWNRTGINNNGESYVYMAWA